MGSWRKSETMRGHRILIFISLLTVRHLWRPLPMSPWRGASPLRFADDWLFLGMTWSRLPLRTVCRPWGASWRWKRTSPLIGESMTKSGEFWKGDMKALRFIYHRYAFLQYQVIFFHTKKISIRLVQFAIHLWIVWYTKKLSFLQFKTGIEYYLAKQTCSEHKHDLCNSPHRPWASSPM